ncbi:hypothetical protein MATL_G00241680 [Megalops atlanticus]|uniref:Uncharacterized protein n=1 Tax=Megalops atlanticus TaxID=7932 RepID=A0A9D3T1D9_MEGAT|nr:hypothetical protein MATL_G00241680 [Megalops atlanticus]
MVLTGVGRVVLLLSVVLLWAGIGETLSFREVLPNIVQRLRNRYEINGEYAMALNIPQEQCTRNPDNNFLHNDPADKVNEALQRNEVYRGRQVIAAKPLRFRDQNNRELTDHAEYRLLVSPDQDEQNSAMHYLLRRQLTDACLVFFSTFSPCVEKCANINHPYSILDHLQVFNFWRQEWTAFAFYDIFNYDKENRERQEVLDSLTAIHNAAKIPIFRCNRYNNQNRCFDCMADPNPNTNACLYGMS